MKRTSSLFRSSLRNVMALGLSVAFVLAASGCSQKCSSCDAQQKMMGKSSKCSMSCKKKCAANCKKPCCAKKGAKTASAAVNTMCPFSGKPVVSSVTASYRGKTVAFCCKGCVGKWNKLSDDEKSKMIAAAK